MQKPEAIQVRGTRDFQQRQQWSSEAQTERIGVVLDAL